MTWIRVFFGAMLALFILLVMGGLQKRGHTPKHCGKEMEAVKDTETIIGNVKLYRCGECGREREMVK